MKIEDDPRKASVSKIRHQDEERTLYVVENFAKFALNHLRKANKGIKILEIGAKNGLLGEQFEKRGYHNLTGQECSTELLKVAETSKIYQEIIIEKFTEHTRSTKMEPASFDVLISLDAFSHKSGNLNENHLDCLVDLIKPGGLLFLGFSEHSYTPRFQETMAELWLKCSLVDSKVVEKYHQQIDNQSRKIVSTRGIFLAYRITQSSE